MKKLFIFSALAIVVAIFSTCKDKSSEKDILEFWVGGVQYEINPNSSSIVYLYNKTAKDTWEGWVSMPVAPSKIVLSPKASINPLATAPQNFENGVDYTVTAEDGSTKTYRVKAERTPYFE